MSFNLSLNHTKLPPQPNHTAIDYSLFTIPITLCLLSALISLIGLVGNGITIYLFCFRLRLNKSTVYILNLAIADFIFVLGCCTVSFYLLCLYNGIYSSTQSDTIFSGFGELLNGFGFNSSLFFLGTLSMERCLLVCFPIWYKCRRPENLSAIMCAIIWVLSLLITILERFILPEHRSTVYIVTSVVFLMLVLLMVGSSVVLCIEIQKSSEQCRPLKLYIVVVATVICFLISLVPARVVRLLYFFAIIPTGRTRAISYIVIFLCSALNSTINPYIYIVVGRWEKGVSTVQAFESVFKEGNKKPSEGDDTTESQLTDSDHKLDALEIHFS
ncbi:mas-related G-protein coupled receptor member H-like [Pseudophryne corroboree]|uniref:mas-related G-protein coupled receptor member H-like n=1 Tax=Pseudophryne corroboree TaxID=495146 RepID=UPI0030816D07